MPVPPARAPSSWQPVAKCLQMQAMPRASSLRPSGSTPSAPGEPVRIAKALARAGLCSRREAERWIAQGRVSVNDEVLASPARDVSARDRILVDGNELPAFEPPRLWR